MHVLVVEDNVHFARALRGALELRGYGCTTAHTLDEGFTMFESERPLAVVSDLRLGARTGLVLLEHVMRMAPGTRRVLMSGDLPHAAGLREGLLHGALSKPFAVDSLCALLGAPLAKTG